MTRSELIAEVAAIVGDDGTGDLGVIVDHADADSSVSDIVQIVLDARAEHAAEVAS